jgi:Holliday junction resolvase-like predicted endonuclease
VRRGYVYHFVEVKTVARGKSSSRTYHPLQNVTREKIMRLKRAAQAYCMKHTEVEEWQFDILCIFMPSSEVAVYEMYLNQLL